VGDGWEVPQRGVAYLPPHLSVVAGRYRGTGGVQQKLLRHAQVSTTMNVYGNALMDAKREANSKVVRKALGSS
jgi:integrase